ncbi:hypothetical protein ABFS82_14G024200 [Erythranthe guttata]|uniref:FHA domain-containing protein At4g14490 n=1 Tax=Erythranthe guttata TaxID=4155 RepID=UPI00064DB5DF|nr:PREDICTED: FHA domain-containing protein At4g14490 [Erythranthe guttata]|eukprot:XP_012842843.1 PREDICTED: FHA domain-containing protein At4g14490 [Erythranthe guttata]
MPPRKKPAPIVEDNQCPVLRLVVDKGPLSGQTNDFRPGSTIHIGRIVRGNTLCIKDAGISSKHLRIQVEPSPDPARRSWAVTDLGSSNGTFLNDVQLDPSEPAVLSEGDVIKLGEQTTINVRFEVSGGENEGGSGHVRRNARRGVRNQVEKLEVLDENSELRLGDDQLGSYSNLGARVKNDKFGDLVDESAVDGEKSRGRRSRSSKKEINVGKLIINKAAENEEQRVEKLAEDEEQRIDKLSEDEEQADKVAEVNVKLGRNFGTRSTRSSKNNENSSKDLGTSGVGVSTRRTRNSRKEDENIVEAVMDLDVIEGLKKPKGKRGRKKKIAETPVVEEEKEEPKLESEIREKEKTASEAGADEFVERASSERKGDAAGLAGLSGVKIDENGKMVADLENMTLGQWFKFLEVYLPKQIIDETEEMISEMKQKSKKLHQFKLQHKNAKDKGKTAID